MGRARTGERCDPLARSGGGSGAGSPAAVQSSAGRPAGEDALADDLAVVGERGEGAGFRPGLAGLAGCYARRGARLQPKATRRRGSIRSSQNLRVGAKIPYSTLNTTAVVALEPEQYLIIDNTVARWRNAGGTPAPHEH